MATTMMLRGQRFKVRAATNPPPDDPNPRCIIARILAVLDECSPTHGRLLWVRFENVRAKDERDVDCYHGSTGFREIYEDALRACIVGEC